MTSGDRLSKDGTIHPLVQYNNFIKFKPKVCSKKIHKGGVQSSQILIY